LKLFSRELTIDEVIGFIRCQSPELTGDCKGCLFVEAAKDLIAEVERLKAENESLAVNGGKYMKIAGYRYELFEKVSDELEKAELENAKLKEKLMSAHDEWQALTIFLEGMKKGNSILKKALELACDECSFREHPYDEYIQQAQEQEVEK